MIIILFVIRFRSTSACAQTASANSPSANSLSAITTTTVSSTTTTTSPACASCTLSQLTLTGGTVAGATPVIPTAGSILTNASTGCSSVVITCTGTGNTLQMEFNAGNNGVITGTTTVSAPLMCDSNGQWELSLGGTTAVITAVDCISV
uniref:C6 domain-containing protein n=1 Tax=Acrobeloides nanus TaxID=290746 RepID=A0A914DC32_9BILA